MRGMRKAFGGVEVLHGVDLDLLAGEVHALVGENGAGKSTLMKILCGVHADYDGRIEIDDRPVRFGSPREAERAGVAIIHQELSLVPYMTVAENIFLGDEPTTMFGTVDHARMRREAAAILEQRLGLSIDVDQPVGELSISVQQLVEVAKALSRHARILIMDEPTSALADAEAERLFEIIAQLKADGVGIIYISHKMEEIYRLADRITVLRDGNLIGSSPTRDLPQEEMISWMVGREIDQFYPKRPAEVDGEVLSVSRLSLLEPETGKKLVDDVSFTVRRGEILGLAGLMGCGHSEVLGAVFGRYGPRPTGAVRVDGRPMPLGSSSAAIRAGMALLTNDRKLTGLVMSMSILHNLTLPALRRASPGGFLRRRLERDMAEPFVDRLSIRLRTLGDEVGTLSGGNQQKVVLAKWLMTEPKVLLLDEPTRGIDVGAKQDIYEQMNQLAEAGIGIVLITSELPELLAMSDRILVMSRGRITAEMTQGQATQERVMAAAM
ncbi:MAG: sugar ABC transporter ATP-binding protein [Phycisphaerae bacterium]|nr:sugar ABC transporter ATP-binding protein [Phycisphaerae bacterium]